jgi:hypothetical protein
MKLGSIREPGSPIALAFAALPFAFLVVWYVFFSADRGRFLLVLVFVAGLFLIRNVFQLRKLRAQRGVELIDDRKSH